MKKIIIPAISLAALLLTGACSIDERTSGDNGNEAMLTLNMGLDGAVQTRAIGDGSGADHLIYAVFDETGTRIEGIEQVSKDVTFPTTETITLAKGQTYRIAFWAQNKACTAYEVSDEMVVNINYEGALGNDETRDAFFKTVEVTVTGDAELDVELTRPFAQLNVGIYESDWTAGKDAGIVISTSRAVVKQAASILNLLDGTVADPKDVTFDFANIPTDALSVDLDGDGTPETYKYLSMNYILPYDGTTGDASTTLNDLEFTFSPEDGNDITLTQGLDAVPVQRNWRTNIIGRILSGNLDINISIDSEFDNDNNVEAPTTTVISNADQLAAALASDADQISVTFANNIEVSGGITLPSNVSLNLNGNKLTAQSIQAANDNSVIAITNGTVGFSGTGNGVELSAGNSTLTLDEVTLDASSLSGTAICSGSNDNPEWADNKIVIINSTIQANHAGILLENAHNLTIENSTINHGYFGITQNGENPGSAIELKNCNITGTYSGIYLSNHAGGTKNTLKVEGGTILSEEESAIEVKKTDISVTGATLSSNASEQTYSVNGGGSSGIGYGIVLAGYAVGTPYEGETSFTNNIFTLAAGENAVGILRYDGEKGAAVISSNEELAAAAIADNATIYLTKGEYVIPAAAKGKTVTFIGTGNPEDVKVAVTKVGTGYENCDYGLD